MLKTKAGFSIVELLVGVAVGLVVVAGAVTLFASISGSTSTLVQTNRMQQELREIALLVTRDIRRAGYSGVVPGQDFNGDGLPDGTQTQVAESASIRADILFNPYLAASADIRVYDAAGTNDCILFTYNLDGDLPASGVAAVVESDEWFGYRRQVVSGRGVLQMKTAGTSPANCTSGTWETISSDEVDITALAFTMTTAEIEIQNLSGATLGVCEAADSCMCIRTVDVDMSQALVVDSNMNTNLADSVRIRNDKVVPVRSALAHCHD